MPREQELTVTCDGVTRAYRVVYRNDPRERAEAVRFFRELPDCHLHPDMGLPPEVYAMPRDEANAYLRRYPIQERWSLLTIGRQSPTRDDDLVRLRHLPELRTVKIFSDRITDVGVKQLLLLEALSDLVLYSRQVTDACLRDIQRLRSLKSLDLQRSPNVSREAALATVDAMPWLEDAWPPPDPAHLAECRRRYRASEGDPSVSPDPSRQAGSSTPHASLRDIDLSRSPLPRIPAELLEKDDIWRLDTIDCGLEVLPEAIGNLTRLRTLYASWGHLTEVPAGIGRLTALEALWLNDNRLTRLPESFRRLCSLRKLSLDNNRLEHFPHSILGLGQLRELRLTDNGITALPDQIGNLTELRSLSLGRNTLATLPHSIDRLTKLTYLGLQGNPIRSLPGELWRLPCLVTLNLAHTGLTELPSEAANIPNIIGVPGRRVHS